MDGCDEKMKKLNEVVCECSGCKLFENRTNVVFGEGNCRAEILFVGEGPGRDEDLQGRPFVGAAGRVLSEMLADIGLQRESVYITNIVKCRPPNNRDPLPEEVKACFKYLDEQLKIIHPKVIVTLGRHSMARFLPGLRISEAHGKAKVVTGMFSEKQVIFPLYHPAVALYNSSMRSVLLEDMRRLPILLEKINQNN